VIKLYNEDIHNVYISPFIFRVMKSKRSDGQGV